MPRTGVCHFQKNLLDKIRTAPVVLLIFTTSLQVSKKSRANIHPPVQVAYALRTAIDNICGNRSRKMEQVPENHKTLYNGLASMGF